MCQIAAASNRVIQCNFKGIKPTSFAYGVSTLHQQILSRKILGAHAPCVQLNLAVTTSNPLLVSKDVLFHLFSEFIPRSEFYGSHVLSSLLNKWTSDQLKTHLASLDVAY